MRQAAEEYIVVDECSGQGVDQDMETVRQPPREQVLVDDSSSTFTASSDEEMEKDKQRWKAMETEIRKYDQTSESLEVKKKVLKWRLLAYKLDEARDARDKERHHAKKLGIPYNTHPEASGLSAPKSIAVSVHDEMIGSLELFCGSAVLTAELKRLGFHAVGVDAPWNKDVPQGPYIKLDLSQEGAVRVILKLISENRVKVVHLAPPCGTASRAREIRRGNESGLS